MLFLAAFGILVFLFFRRAPKGEPAFGKRVFEWSRWGLRSSFGQAMIVLATVLIPMIRFQWRSLLELFLYPVLYPRVAPSESDAVSSVLLLFTMFLPMGYALLIKRVIVVPLSDDRVPSKRMLNIVVAAGGMGVLVIVAVALEMARFIGSYFLGIFLPIFVGFFVCGVLFMGIARTQL